MSILISINGRFISQRLTGVQRYALETVLALDKLLTNMPPSQQLRCELLVPRGSTWRSGDLNTIKIRQIGRFTGHLWEQLELPIYAQGVLLNFCNSYPLLAWKPIVTVHDAAIYAAPGGYKLTYRLFYRLLFSALRWRRSIPVLTDSAFSAFQLQRYIKIPQQRINVIHCGADHWASVEPDDSILTRLNLTPKTFVLGVASENPNKNLARLINAFERISNPSLRLVLVGGKNSQVFAKIAGTDSARVVRAGHVTDRELAALYQAATCFAFPSLYEGFGIPPLEAMTFGCPVLSSREASLPEVCGDAALYCNGYEEQSISEGLTTMLDAADTRKKLIELGHTRIKQFKWKSTAEQVLSCVRALT
ncbi:MAG: glycosyltransferase family 4 protein [Nevskia sp.]|jgi:glycosyltransferase involved in cell wall biosynthesis|nr:glycosyltransferase family 4 protein [Nevskia sp.]MCK9386374.1 glycosyltransferase family 4 protein [Nevskia sp.]